MEWSCILVHYSSEGRGNYKLHTSSESPSYDLFSKPTLAKIHQRFADFLDIVSYRRLIFLVIPLKIGPFKYLCPKSQQSVGGFLQKWAC